MGSGQMSSATTFKINEAFTLGNLDGNKTALGVACTIKTVEKTPASDRPLRGGQLHRLPRHGERGRRGARVQHQAHQRPPLGLHLSAGHHALRGWRALAYVRARYTLGNGSDLERIGASRPSCPRWSTG
jgi:anionic cell wall polymer biosynthesis LytR-Cps2A-Psr (LCP) family protein